MKNIKIFTFGLTIFGLTALFFTVNSCNKNPTVLVNKHTFKSDTVVASEDSVFNKKIVYFDSIIQKYADDTNYTNSKQLSSDSAVWYLEAWFNAKYAYPDEQYSKTGEKTDSVNMSINSGNMIDMDDIAATGQQIYSKVKAAYTQSTLSNKELLLVNLGIKRISTTDVVVNVNTVIGEKTQITVNYDPFDGSWYYGEMLGDCDLSSYENTDAAHKIAEAVMANKPISMPCAGCYYTYSDIDTIPLQGYENQNGNGEYLIFYIVRPDGNFTPDDKCLDPDEMNFHYHGEETVIYDILEPQLNKSFMSCTLIGKQDWDQYGNARIRHDNKLTFGIMHLHHPGIGFIKKEYIAD